MTLPELVANTPSIGVAQALTTLSGAMTSVQTTVPVNGAAPAALQGTGQFRIIIGGEVIIVDASTSSSGVSWTAVTRGAEGSTAAAHNAGDNVNHVLTAEALKEFVGHYYARAWRSAAFSLTLNTWTQIPLDSTETGDDPNAWFSGGNIVIGKRGRYRVTGNVQVGAGSNPTILVVGIGRGTQERQNNNVCPSAIAALNAEISAQFTCAVNDTFSLYANSNVSAINMPTPNPDTNFLEVERIGS